MPSIESGNRTNEREALGATGPRTETGSEAPAASEATAVGAPTDSRGERLRRFARRVRVFAWTALLVAMIVILIGLIAANTRRVKVSWVFGDTTERLVWIILVAALVGWVAGIATGVVARRRIWRNS